MNTAIENILRNISKQLEEIKKSNITLIERCAVNTVGDPLKVFGLVSLVDGAPFIKWYYVDGTMEIVPYEGVVVNCN
jgi:hypothetical protein